MKKFRIIISLILAISLLPVFPAFAEEDIVETELEQEYVAPEEEPADTTVQDVVEEVVEELPEEPELPVTETEAFAKLNAFGIMTAEDEILSVENINRIQFMTYVMKCLFGNDVSVADIPANNIFSDLKAGEPGTAEVAVAHSLGIISAADKFRPDDLITMPEAAKIMMSVLGYNTIAVNKGGYPTGYLALASEHKLFEDCKFTSEGYITVDCFVQALVNMLETDVMEMSAVWSGLKTAGASYTITADKTLLEYAFGIYRTEGIVESNRYTSINGITTMYDDMVEIDGVKYKDNGINAGEYLGYNTEVYYSMDKPELNRIIRYIAPFKNEVISVVSDDIVPASTTDTNFAYYDETRDRVRNEAIPRSATLIYNGGQKSLTAANIIPANGTVTLVDNNSDNKVDVVFVMNYRTILVSSVSPNSGTVGDLLGGTSIALDSEDDTYDVYVEVDGIPAGLESINVRNVISYAESTGCTKNVKYVKVSTKNVEGAVEAIGDETVVINGQEYYITDSLRRALSLKDYGFFYLDINNKIVAKKSEKDVVYGYFNRVIQMTGMEETICAQIFTENDRWVELELKDKINYTSSEYNGDNVASDVFYSDWINNRTEGQLFTYTVDADGKVNMIAQPKVDYTVDYTDAEREDYNQDVFRKHAETGKKLTYTVNGSSSAWKCFGTEFFVNDNTKFFAIPADNTNMDEFAVMSVNNLANSTEHNNVVPYNYDAFRTAGVVVMEATESVSRTASIMVVDTVMRSYNSEGKTVDAIRGYYKGILITMPLASDSVLSAISTRPSRGDVIRFKMNSAGDISVIKDTNISDERAVFYDYSAHTTGTNDFIVTAAKGTSKTTTDCYGTSYVLVGGKIDYVDASAGKFLVDVNGSKLVLGTDKSSAFYAYDVLKKEFKEGSIADVESGKKVYIRMYYGLVRDCIIYQ